MVEIDPPFSKSIFEKHGEAFRPWEEDDFSRTISSLCDHLPNANFTVCVSTCLCSSFGVIVFVPTIPKNILGTLLLTPRFPNQIKGNSRTDWSVPRIFLGILGT